MSSPDEIGSMDMERLRSSGNRFVDRRARSARCTMAHGIQPLGRPTWHSGYTPFHTSLCLGNGTVFSRLCFNHLRRVRLWRILGNRYRVDSRYHWSCFAFLIARCFARDTCGGMEAQVFKRTNVRET